MAHFDSWHCLPSCVAVRHTWWYQQHSASRCCPWSAGATPDLKAAANAVGGKLSADIRWGSDQATALLGLASETEPCTVVQFEAWLALWEGQPQCEGQQPHCVHWVLPREVLRQTLQRQPQLCSAHEKLMHNSTEACQGHDGPAVVLDHIFLYPYTHHHHVNIRRILCAPYK